MANEFCRLPQDIIHHIQSFLNAREEAQSSILAKSWYISRPTRPVLAFDENKFSHPREGVFSHKFSEFSTGTLHRFKTQNLKLDKFVLKMKIRQEHKPSMLFGYLMPAWGMTEHDFSQRNRLAGELITSALELGVSQIKLILNYYANFNLRYDLPAQVFASTSLTRLLVDRYVIDGVVGDRVLCSRLKSLVLYCVKTKDEVVRDILARCPLLENLELRHCVGIDKLNVSKMMNLVEFRYTKGLMVNVEFIDLGMNVTEFCFLRRLELKKVRIGAEFFTMFSSMFPCIEDLTLGYCEDYEEISISSSSLRRLTLCQWERLTKVQLNVPNISKFVFEAGLNDDNELVHIDIKDVDLDDNRKGEWEENSEAGSDNIDEADSDNINEAGSDNIDEAGSDNIDEAGSDNIDEVGSDNIDEVGSDNIDEVGSDNTDDAGLDNIDEAGSDNIDEVGSDNIDETGLDNIDEVGSDNIDETGLDNIDEAGNMDEGVSDSISEDEWDNVDEGGWDSDDNKRNDFKLLPSITFDSVPRDLECNVLVWWQCKVIEACRLVDLRKFLTQFTHSRISLDVRFSGKAVIPGEEIPCFRPVVEKLKVCVCFSWRNRKSLLHGLSRSCSSNLITECDECQC